MVSLKPRLRDLLARRAQFSYSQSGEDLIVRFALNAMGVQKPNYIDIGAYHPYDLSNTAHFYEIGCRGINVEPNPVLFRAFQKYRKHDVNLNVGVMDEPGVRDFHIMSTPAMSTFSKEEADELVAEHGFETIETRKIKVVTISEVLGQYGANGYPQFMSLDVEGTEEQILRSMEFDLWSPLVICCETISYSTAGVGTKNKAIVRFLESRGYMTYADTYINTIFVLEDAWRTGREQTKA